jgi:putative salt-induced outer membrane protein YdiY
MSVKKLYPLVGLALAFAAPSLAQTPPPDEPPACKCPCPCPPPPPPPLTGSLGAGLSVTTGNSDTTSFNLSFGLTYDPKTHSLFKADAFYLRTTANGETDADKGTASLRYEYKFTDQFYGFAQVSYLRDQPKNITYMVSTMVGAGYYVVKEKTLELSLDGSIGGVFEKDAGFDSTSSGAFGAGEAFTWKFSPNASLTQKASGLWKTDNTADSFYHFDIGLAASLLTNFELKVSYIIDYKSRPHPEDLKKTDTALIAALIYKF